jgi:hypothetical protein
MMVNEYGTVCGMRIGRGNRIALRRPVPVPLCAPHIPHNLGSNSGCRSGNLVTNRLSYVSAPGQKVDEGIGREDEKKEK